MEGCPELLYCGRPAGTELGLSHKDERPIEACVVEGTLPTTHMRANAAWDLHHCYGDRGGEEGPCDPLTRQLDANAVVDPCAVLGGGTLVDRNPPVHQAAWKSKNFTTATSVDVGTNQGRVHAPCQCCVWDLLQLAQVKWSSGSSEQDHHYDQHTAPSPGPHW